MFLTTHCLYKYSNKLLILIGVEHLKTNIIFLTQEFFKNEKIKKINPLIDYVIVLWKIL